MKLDIGTNDSEKYFFTSDHHFGHENIIKFCKRPFDNVQQMDETMIETWNKVIPPDGIVFHLGDVTLGDDAEQYFKRLNGKYIYVLGVPWHHDKRWMNLSATRTLPRDYCKSASGWVSIRYPEIVLEIQSLGRGGYPHAIHLSHYPLAEWDRKHYGSWHLHGHSHGNHKYTNGEYAIDVGVDNWNFHPLSFGGILDTMYDYGWVN